MARGKFFQVRLTQEEQLELKALAELAQETASDVVRRHIRQAYLEAFPDRPDPKEPSDA